MKLIIDIKDNYKSLITSAWSYGVAPSRTVLEDVSKAVMNGIPLDDIKAEFISLYPKNVYGGLELGGRSCVFSLNKVFEVIDKHTGKGAE